MMNINRNTIMIQKNILQTIPGILLTLFLAFCLKKFFSQAGADELDWMLRPVAFGTSILTGTHFTADGQLGYVSRDGATIIAPACSGINFMIAALLTMFFSGLRRFNTVRAITLWSIACLVAAYGYTIAVNILRIVSAMALYGAGIQYGWFTEARLHRLSGVVIYFFALWISHRVICRRPGQEKLPRAVSVGPGWLVPLFCYFGVVLLVPLLRNPSVAVSPLFHEHVGTITVGCGLVLGAVFLVHLWRRPARNA